MIRWQYRTTVLTLCTLAFFATMVARVAICPVVPAILDEFAVSRGMIGLALTGLWMAYVLTQFPSGILVDRYGERQVDFVALASNRLLGLGY